MFLGDALVAVSENRTGEVRMIATVDSGCRCAGSPEQMRRDVHSNRFARDFRDQGTEVFSGQSSPTPHAGPDISISRKVWSASLPAAARSLFDLRTGICSNPRAGRTRFRAARGPLLGVIWPAGLLPHWVTSPSHPPSPAALIGYG
jgi:hypothetical protein